MINRGSFFHPVGFMISLWQVLFETDRFNIVYVSSFLSLYGTTLAQTISYFRSFPSDGRPTKFLVSQILLSFSVRACPPNHNTWSRFFSFGRRIQFPEPVLVRFILFASAADTLHVFLLSHMFWHFLIYGRSIGFLVLLRLPWSISPPSSRP